jgi:hypothetical protein
MAQSQPQLQFAYWVPNVSGGLVVSNIEQRTEWNIEYNKKLAQTAEKMALAMRCHKSVLLRVMARKISMSPFHLAMQF